jgi:hypothetical protein
MALKICCPQGHKFLLNDDLAGKRIACPTCRTPIDVPDPSQVFVADEVAPAQAYAEPLTAEVLPEPARHKGSSVIRKVDKAELQKVKRSKERQGLQLVGIGFLLLGFGMVALGLAMAMAFFGGIAAKSGGGIAHTGISMLAFSGGAAALAILLDFVGIAFLYAVPSRAGARGLLILCTIFSLLSFSPPLLQFFRMLTGDWGPYTFAVLVLLIGMAQKITLFMYVQAVANFIKVEGYTPDCQALMLQTVLLPLVSIGVIVLGALILPIYLVGPLTALIMLIIVIIFWVLYGIRYCKLMFDLRSDVS